MPLMVLCLQIRKKNPCRSQHDKAKNNDSMNQYVKKVREPSKYVRTVFIGKLIWTNFHQIEYACIFFIIIFRIEWYCYYFGNLSSTAAAEFIESKLSSKNKKILRLYNFLRFFCTFYPKRLSLCLVCDDISKYPFNSKFNKKIYYDFLRIFLFKNVVCQKKCRWWWLNFNLWMWNRNYLLVTGSLYSVGNTVFLRVSRGVFWLGS